MDKKGLINEAAQYFKNNKGFNRSIKKIREKYRSLGKIGGKITIRNLTQDEQEALSGFLDKGYYSKKNTVISVAKFQKSLDNSKFSGVRLEDVLEEYFGENILSKKEKKRIYEEEREKFLSDIIREFRNTPAYEWISYILENKENAYRIIIKRYDEDRENLKADLINTLNGINKLPYVTKLEKRERLALFSSKITKNPHTFDENTEGGKLLLHGISFLLGKEYPKSAEERSEYYFKVGLIKDEISNYTVCSGLVAYRNSEIAIGWKDFYDNVEPMHVSLWNLSNIKRVISPIKKVFIFENPTVFSEVLYRLSNIKPPIVCTFGQVKLASLVLLDMLTKEGTQIFYSGDFDPEGIMIADRLKKRYGNRLTLWRFNKDDYYKALSDKKIDDKRMKKLDNIEDMKLKELSISIKEKGYAGYQELIIDELIDDMILSIT